MADQLTRLENALTRLERREQDILNELAKILDEPVLSVMHGIRQLEEDLNAEHDRAEEAQQRLVTLTESNAHVREELAQAITKIEQEQR